MRENKEEGVKRDAGTREKDGDVIEIVGIDKLVPADHLLRKIEAAVDFNRLYEMESRCFVRIMAGRA